MNDIFDTLYDLYLNELHNLNMGYVFNYKNLNYMWELIQVLDFLTNGDPTSEELSFLLEYYG